MKKLLCLLFAALLLCVSASALELPSELDGTVPRELIDNAETNPAAPAARLRSFRRSYPAHSAS